MRKLTFGMNLSLDARPSSRATRNWRSGRVRSSSVTSSLASGRSFIQLP